eukprot:TRINITY_DN4320_c0_g2_i1.p1 TRINITY_DN4320_c0_g2~~TRINITY_DN4320_c0_g2_i1.p1  ORF type:complete len:294 (+),score=59.59 TRINITY_DN4320_c0_g2_i1:2-883(+)
MRPQERNILATSHNLLLFTLSNLYIDTNAEMKETIAQQISYVFKRLIKVLNAKVMPHLNMDQVIVFLKLKLKCFDTINQYGSPEDKEEIKVDLQQVRNLLVHVKTNQDIMSLSSPPSTSLVQITLSYCNHCCEYLHRNLLAYWIGRHILAWNDNEEVTVDADPRKSEDHQELIMRLRSLLANIEANKEIYKIPCARTIKGEYLRRRSEESEELSMPLWVLYGFWENRKFIFVYSSIDAKEANEIFVVPDDIAVASDENENTITLANIPGQQPIIWQTPSTNSTAEWAAIFESI